MPELLGWDGKESDKKEKEDHFNSIRTSAFPQAEEKKIKTTKKTNPETTKLAFPSSAPPRK